MRDSNNSAGAYGQNLMNGAKNIDPAFFGAAFIHITGS
jgi:hypothetical protein